MDALTHTLRTERLDATFRVSPHLLGVSLRHRGVELLREIDALEQSGLRGDPCGIPLLHPWANRLERPGYSAVGTNVRLDLRSPLLRQDARGLPLHGVPWSLVRTGAHASDARACTVRLDWNDPPLLKIFPFVHALHVHASVHDATLTMTTELLATGTEHVPVSFGYHPYLGLPGLTRDAWRLGLPERAQMPLDHRGLPTGESYRCAPSLEALGVTAYDEAFVLPQSRAVFTIADDTRRIRVQCVDGYTHAQVYAPADRAFVCIEPMTAPVNALCSGHGLRTVAPGERFSATFRIAVDDCAG